MRIEKRRLFSIYSILVATFFILTSSIDGKAKEGHLFIPKDIYESAGYILPKPDIKNRIVGSLEKKVDLSEQDIVFIDIGKNKGVVIGDQYTVFKIVKSVSHPVSKKGIGHLVRILGILDIQVVGEKRSRAIITKSYHPINVNDPIEKYKEAVEVPLDISPKSAMTAYIVSSKDLKTGLGTDDIVYIDKGSKDGVRTLDIFQILEKKEGGKEQIEPPKGEIIILSVQDNTATAMISKSTKLIETGDMLLYKGRSK
ncbi:MAG TPA: hypothetical protein VMW81_10255 [Nitrospinota bacterium]|nr:hypothetical protein [Nitrospinota bacterium]